MKTLTEVNSIIALSAILLFSGCDSTTSADDSTNYYGNKVITAASELPACTADLEGQLYYILDTREFQFCDGTGYQIIDVTGETGEQGPEGPTIKVYDRNNTLLGYNVDAYSNELLILSPNGYLFEILILNGDIIFHSKASIYFTSYDCTGTPYASEEQTEVVKGVLMYNKGTESLYARNGLDTSIQTMQSAYDSDGVCGTTDETGFYYEMIVISKNDAGIPSTIVPPLQYVRE